jgi:hypothetical protein
VVVDDTVCVVEVVVEDCVAVVTEVTVVVDEVVTHDPHSTGHAVKSESKAAHITCGTPLHITVISGLPLHVGVVDVMVVVDDTDVVVVVQLGSFGAQVVEVVVLKVLEVAVVFVNVVVVLHRPRLTYVS